MQERKPLPRMTDFGEEKIKREMRETAGDVLRKEIQSMLMKAAHENGRFPSGADLIADIEDKLRRLSSGDREKMLRAAIERACKERVDKMVKDNYASIKQDVQNIIATENAKLKKPHVLNWN